MTQNTTHNHRPGLLDGYVHKGQLCEEWDCHPRTIARYEQEPDGLPYVYIGGRKWYAISDARAFMERRTVRPNPTRKSA